MIIFLCRILPMKNNKKELVKTCISILRGINVSGQKKIIMSELTALYESLALKNVTTYIQSGNVVFKTDLKLSDEQFAQKIEQAIFEKYNFHVPVIIRTAEEIKHIITTNPFLKEKEINTDKLHVSFLSAMPGPATLEKIKTYDYPPDRFYISGKEVYLYCPESYGETKLSNKFFENKLQVTATTRNWKTVNKLLEMAREI